MKNNIFYLFFTFFFLFFITLSADELEVNSSKIQYNNANKITTFEGNVRSEDKKGNQLFSEYAKYNKVINLFETNGETKIITSGGYEILSSNVFLDNKSKKIYSNYKTQITDLDGNKIFVDMFDYSILTSIFFSKGNIKILDINNNNYNFSEIYIDEKKKKIIGSDIKAFLNQESILINKKNEPKFFANTMSLFKDVNTFEKGVFTYCKNREGDKCPPWVLQSKKIKHDLAKKTIFYEDVVLKVYDFPIFYSPKFSHPDPTVKRRSGLLAPSLTSSNSLGSAFAIPYFFNIANDKDLTFTPKLYLNENPVFLGVYKQAFKNSFLTVDAGYTKGYKKTSLKKSSGGRSHFFSNFNIDLINEKEKFSTLELKTQKVSNDTYLKVHDINTELVDASQNILKNTIDYQYQNKDFFFVMTPGYFEDTDKLGHLRHEYLLPINIEKNLMSNEKYGFVDLDSNIKIRNYDTNKKSNFLVNNFNWKSNKWLNKLGIENYFEGLVKTVNYKAENTDKYKNENSNAEANAALGYFAKLGLYKNDIANNNFYTLTPKFLLRYAPGHMRKIDGGRLNYGNVFNLNKTNEFDVIESGLSSSIGFEYKKNKLEKNNVIGDETFSFAAAQVISEKENMDISSRTSLEQRFSDVVGVVDYKINDKMDLSYNFSIDQNYKDLNYNEIRSDFKFDDTKFNISYLQEKKHIGDQEQVKYGFDFKINNSSELSFKSKRNLLTSSAEFYNLSYNYINDCLKAGIAYRREFYTDRDIEPENTLMFTISIIPFAQINSPGITK